MAYVVDCDRLDGKERLQSYGGNLRSLCSGGTARLQAHTNEVREACLGANGSFLRAERARIRAQDRSASGRAVRGSRLTARRQRSTRAPRRAQRRAAKTRMGESADGDPAPPASCSASPRRAA
jgi:hypothetical protein